MTDSTPTIPDFAVHYKVLPIVTLNEFERSREVNLLSYVDFNIEPDSIEFIIENALDTSPDRIQASLNGHILTVSASPAALDNPHAIEIDIQVVASADTETVVDTAVMMARIADGTVSSFEPGTPEYTNGWRIRVQPRGLFWDEEDARNNTIVLRHNDLANRSSRTIRLEDIWQPVVTPDETTEFGGRSLPIPLPDGVTYLTATYEDTTDSTLCPYTVSYSVVSGSIQGFFPPMLLPAPTYYTGRAPSYYFNRDTILNPWTTSLRLQKRPGQYHYRPNQEIVIRISVTYNGTTQTNDLTLRPEVPEPTSTNKRNYREPANWVPPNFERSYTVAGPTPLEGFPQPTLYVYEIGSHPLGQSELLSSEAAAEREAYNRLDGSVFFDTPRAVHRYMRQGMREDGFWMLRHVYTDSYFGWHGTRTFGHIPGVIPEADTPVAGHNVQNAVLQIIYGSQRTTNTANRIFNNARGALDPALSRLKVTFKGADYLNTWSSGVTGVPTPSTGTVWGIWTVSPSDGRLADIYEVPPFQPAPGQPLTAPLTLLDSATSYQVQAFAPRGTYAQAPYNNNYLPQYRVVSEGAGHVRNPTYPVYTPITKEDFTAIKLVTQIHPDFPLTDETVVSNFTLL